MREESTVHECKKSPTILKISLPLQNSEPEETLHMKILQSILNITAVGYFESSNQKKTCIKIVTLEIKILHMNDY